MAGSRAREGRRRRVLCEEARAQATVGLAVCQTEPEEQAPRYGEQANVENHPQITDFIPRRRATVLLAVTGLLGVAAGCQTLAAYAPQVAALLPGIDAAAIRMHLATGVAAWVSAATLLAVTVILRVVYSLRRHRVDDQHGRYRVWRWAAWGTLLWSVNCIVGGHVLLSRAAATALDWSLTAGGAEWWLIPTALIGAWLATGLLLEIAESRLALILALGAASAYCAAAIGCLGWSPDWLGPWNDLLTRSMPLVGHAMTLGAAAFFARHVVLDVQGLIEHPRSRPEAMPSAATPTTPASPPPSPPVQVVAENDEACTWIDGSEPESDDEPEPKLSKAERKRLRKQKARNRAA